MITKKLKTQITNALIHIIESLVIFVLCAYCSIGVYYHGAGTRGRNYGLKRIFADWIYKMEDQGNDTLVKTILLAMFAAAAAAGLVALIYYLLHLTPGMTKLGRSIRKQAASYEKLSELIELIDTDLERESQMFGTELRISPQWIAGEEVMRLNRVREISVDESWKAHKLILTDKDFNKMEVSFSSIADLENSVRLLRKKLPDIPAEGLPEGFAAGAWEPSASTIFSSTPPSPKTINAAAAGNCIAGSASIGSTSTSSASTSSTPAIPLSKEEEQTRALAFAAPLRMVNYEYDKELGAQSTSAKKQAKMQKALAKKQNIQSKDQLLSNITSLYLGEKTSRYDALLPIITISDRNAKQEYLKQHGMDEDWQEVFFKMIEKAQKLFAEYHIRFPGPDDTLYAWELSEAAELAVHGAAAGYLTGKEEIDRLLEIGRIAERFYQSWEEYAGAFLLGYFFDQFFRQSSASHAEIYMAGKSEVKEIRHFLKDKTYMTCPFGTYGSGAGSLPEHYRSKWNI